MPEEELVDGVVLPSQLNRFENSPWPARIIPILFGPLLVWGGAVILGDPATRYAVAPFAVPGLVLIEVLLMYGMWRNPNAGQAGDLVVTRLGVIRRYPNVAVFIPWTLAEPPRRDALLGDSMRYRVSIRARQPLGRLKLTSDQAEEIRVSPFNPKPDLGVARPPRAPTASLLGRKTVQTTTQIGWPAGPESHSRVSRAALEPAASRFLQFALTFLILAFAIVALPLGYIYGSLLIPVAYFVPFPFAILVGRRLGAAELRSWQVASLVLILALGPPVIWTAAIALYGWGAFGYPGVYALLPIISAIMGIFVGFLFTTALKRPGVFSDFGSSGVRTPSSGS